MQHVLQFTVVCEEVDYNYNGQYRDLWNLYHRSLMGQLGVEALTTPFNHKHDIPTFRQQQSDEIIFFLMLFVFIR